MTSGCLYICFKRKILNLLNLSSWSSVWIHVICYHPDFTEQWVTLYNMYSALFHPGFSEYIEDPWNYMGNLHAKVSILRGGFFPKFRIKHVCSKFDLRNKHVSLPKFAILGMYVATLGKKSIGPNQKSLILGMYDATLSKKSIRSNRKNQF